MTGEILTKLEQLINGRFKPQPAPPNDQQDSDEFVDATVLGELIKNTYSKSGRSTSEVAQWLLKTIEDYDDTQTDLQQQKKVTLKTFSNFLDKRVKRLKDIFSRLDTDKDATISLEDVYAYLETHNLKCDRHKLEQVFSMFDHNKDGEISYDEFARQLLLVPSYGRRSEGRFFYRAYDFFVEDLEISPDSDVVMSIQLQNGMGYFYAGGFAGVISRTCTAPFDRLKVYLIANSTHHYPVTLKEALKAIYRSGTPPGLRAFFTGNGLNIIKVLPESAMKFGAFETAKRALAHLEGVEDPADLSRTSTFLAGGIGGMISQFFVYPIDTVKYRVQCASQNTSGGSGNVSGFRVLKTVFKDMIREGGLNSFYRGLYVGVIGIFPFAALDLGLFTAFKSAYIKSEARRLKVDESEVQLGSLAVLSMGAISGSVGASVVYPVNLIRTRIQTQGTPAHPFTYNGFMDCYNQSLKREGWRGLFRGLGPNLAKVAPSVSISYLVYENSKRLMGLP